MSELIENWYKDEKNEEANYKETRHRIKYVWWLEYKLKDAMSVIEKILMAHEHGTVDLDAMKEATKFIGEE